MLKIAKNINFNIGYVTNVTFLEVGSNYDIFKQASKNNPVGFHSTRGSRDVAMTICKIFIKVLENGLNQLLAYVVPKLAKVWHIDFIENVAE